MFAFPEKANTSVIYMENVTNLLLSTMLTKHVCSVLENTKIRERNLWQHKKTTKTALFDSNLTEHEGIRSLNN